MCLPTNDMDYSSAVLEKAQRLEQLLQRVAAGESLDEVNEALDFTLDQRQLARWQAKKYEDLTKSRVWIIIYINLFLSERNKTSVFPFLLTASLYCGK